MPFEGPEPILDATEATLRAKLPAAVAAVNARWPGEPQIVVPDADAYYVGGWTIIKYPCVEIAVADFDLSGLSVGQIDADILTPLVVRGWVQDARVETGRLYRRAMRFSAALVRSLSGPDAFGPNAQLAGDRAIRGAFRFNPENDERDDVEAACLLVIYLEAVEDLV